MDSFNFEISTSNKLIRSSFNNSTYLGNGAVVIEPGESREVFLGNGRCGQRADHAVGVGRVSNDKNLS